MRSPFLPFCLVKEKNESVRYEHFKFKKNEKLQLVKLYVRRAKYQIDLQIINKQLHKIAIDIFMLWYNGIWYIVVCYGITAYGILWYAVV